VEPAVVAVLAHMVANLHAGEASGWDVSGSVAFATPCAPASYDVASRLLLGGQELEGACHSSERLSLRDALYNS
jgi:hypothetical protein